MKYFLKIIMLLLIYIHTTAFAGTLKIFPDAVTLKWGESTEFHISGQKGQVQWISIKGEINSTVRKTETAEFMPGVTMETGQIQIVQGNKIKYTAPHQTGTYSIAATDGFDMAIARVQVPDINEAVIMLDIFTGGKETLVVGSQLALSLKGWLPNATQQDYTAMATWESSDSSILNVDNSGVLTALATGTATISASLWGKTANIKMTVEPKVPLRLIISPTPVYLVTTQGSQKLTIEIALKDSAEKQPAPDCQLTANPEGLIDIIDRELKALNPGYTTVKAVCNDLEANIPVFINSPFPLETSLETLNLDREESQTFHIIGGIPPYTVTATTGKIKHSGEQVSYKAARLAGTDTVRIEDQGGQVVELPVTIADGLILLPLIVDVAAHASQKFSVSGGVPPYQWQASAGVLSANDGNEITYTTTGVQGNYELTVIDNKGHLKTAVINVDNGLMASPSEMILSPEEEQRFFVTGGTPPYKVSVTAGNYTEENGSYDYVAPSISGSYQIIVRDAEDRRTTIQVIVQSSLQVSPSELFLLRNEEAELQITGGYGDYSIVTETGELRDNRIYQAANVAGQDVITISDKAGAVVQVNVLVSQEGLYVSPVRSYVLPNEKVKLRAFGGTTPYRWRVLGEGDLSSTEGEQVLFTAPEVAGVYRVLVSDNTDKKIEHTVTVYQGELQLSPEILVLAPGNSANLRALLGVPTYHWWTENGNLSASEGQEVVYTAPKDKFEDTIWLKDASGKVKALRTVISTGSVNICGLYAGSDEQLDDTELNNAIDDYFQKQGWINRTELFFLLENCKN